MNFCSFRPGRTFKLPRVCVLGQLRKEVHSYNKALIPPPPHVYICAHTHTANSASLYAGTLLCRCRPRPHMLVIHSFTSTCLPSLQHVDIQILHHTLQIRGCTAEEASLGLRWPGCDRVNAFGRGREFAGGNSLVTLVVSL